MSSRDRVRTILWRCQSVVWIASWLVPRDQRSQWRAEHNRKFWHWCHFLAESGQLTPQNRLTVAQHCWATFPAAFWMRFERERLLSQARRLIASPTTFLAAFAAALAVLVLGSGFVPATRTAFSSPVPHPAQVVLVTLDGNGINGKFGRTRSDTLLDLASIWSKSKLVNGVSPFSWAPGRLMLQERELPIASARVGPDFFAALGVKPTLGRTFGADDVHNCPGCVLLSYPIWQHEFNHQTDIVGKAITLDGSTRTVIGVLPGSFNLISSGIAVWSQIDPATLFTNFERRVGAVAQLNRDASPEQVQRDLSDLTESAGYVHPSSQLQVTTIQAQVRRNFQNTLWFLLLAIGSAAFVVILRQSSNSLGHLPPGLALRATWLGFFVLKSVLLLAIAAIGSWTLIHWISGWLVGSVYPVVDEFSIWLFLPMAIAALSWSVRDQQKRCRICLRRLEMPVEIGRTGSILLNWAGTEMVCSEGHGVLYLPDSPANAMERDRWNRLDDSWADLFHAD